MNKKAIIAIVAAFVFGVNATRTQDATVGLLSGVAAFLAGASALVIAIKEHQ
ncbi:MAG: hypothetical protein SPI12_01650 [Actinomycetaceae bacterium]|nr:hypothetical protein [Actinomycetaceae bacterium]MDY6082552.1 hypothetical protein [Actinomycetaceae bacterium]